MEVLRRQFITGELSPGDRVRQEEVAERLGSSVAPVREALAILEQEGQVTYKPRRGYWVTRLEIEDMEEIYELRRLLETRVARGALPALTREDRAQIELAASDCAAAAAAGDVTAGLEANRRFHFAVLSSTDQVHALRLIRLLWDSTDTYRAFYYNSPRSRQESIEDHERILAAIRDRDVNRLVAELDEHRRKALARLTEILL